MVSSLNIKLSGEQIRSSIRTIDRDDGGFIDFPEFDAAVKRHEDVSIQEKANKKKRTTYIECPHIIMVAKACIRACIIPTGASDKKTYHDACTVRRQQHCILTTSGHKTSNNKEDGASRTHVVTRGGSLLTSRGATTEGGRKSSNTAPTNRTEPN